MEDMERRDRYEQFREEARARRKKGADGEDEDDDSEEEDDDSEEEGDREVPLKGGDEEEEQGDGKEKGEGVEVSRAGQAYDGRRSRPTQWSNRQGSVGGWVGAQGLEDGLRRVSFSKSVQQRPIAARTATAAAQGDDSDEDEEGGAAPVRKAGRKEGAHEPAAITLTTTIIVHTRRRVRVIAMEMNVFPLLACLIQRREPAGGRGKPRRAVEDEEEDEDGAPQQQNLNRRERWGRRRTRARPTRL